jgi:hypothetical protein
MEARGSHNLVRSWDAEGDLVARHVVGEKVVELGCGQTKTVPHAICVDMVPSADIITADTTTFVSTPLPFATGAVDTLIARRILENMLDPINAIREWKAVLRQTGRLIIAALDQAKANSTRMGVEHLHALDAIALDVLLTEMGFRVIAQLDPDNGVSFITVAEKL